MKDRILKNIHIREKSIQSRLINIIKSDNELKKDIYLSIKEFTDQQFKDLTFSEERVINQKRLDVVGKDYQDNIKLVFELKIKPNLTKNQPVKYLDIFKLNDSVLCFLCSEKILNEIKDKIKKELKKSSIDFKEYEKEIFTPKAHIILLSFEKFFKFSGINKFEKKLLYLVDDNSEKISWPLNLERLHWGDVHKCHEDWIEIVKKVVEKTNIYLSKEDKFTGAINYFNDESETDIIAGKYFMYDEWGCLFGLNANGNGNISFFIGVKKSHKVGWKNYKENSKLPEMNKILFDKILETDSFTLLNKGKYPKEFYFHCLNLELPFIINNREILIGQISKEILKIFKKIDDYFY